MRKGIVFYKNEEAGTLTQLDDGSFLFNYNAIWFANQNKPAISLTLPKKTEPFESKYLFPFFYNMLPEGSNKQIVCRHLRIEPDDDFGLLLATAKYDTIGAITIKRIDE